MAGLPAYQAYSMLGYNYPQAFFQLSPGHQQQQQLGLVTSQSWASPASGGGGDPNAQPCSAPLGYGTADSYGQAMSVAKILNGFGPVLSGGGYSQQPLGGGFNLSSVGSLAPGYAAAASSTAGVLRSKVGVKGGGDRSSSACQTGPPVTGLAAGGHRREAAGGEGEEYLQELIKERDSIESSSTSSLSKTHILRLLNRG
jgi:hypothetical protein